MRITLLLSTLLFLTACGPDIPFTPAERLAGEWTCTMDGSQAVLHADGTWTSLAPDLSQSEGTFKATWKTIEFMAASGPCADLAGSYGYILSRDTLLFTLKDDSCELRTIKLDYAWTRGLSPSIPAVEQGEAAIEDAKGE
ncbi:MAG: hypothetical protein CMJ39_03350 [Phycisphaerae bacterium]|nr:hypothetical protein [Phycisphaerae bacterium]|tara:strand:+ start:198 stop:617 length:420 start_codon:yes stop_codon:yes gene_type:complete